MIKTISTLILIFSSMILCAQDDSNIVHGKYYNYFTYNNAPDLTQIHLADSLIKSIPERGVIEIIEGGDYTYRADYIIFYLKKDSLIYHASNTFKMLSRQQIFDISKIIKEVDTSSFGRHIIYLYTDRRRSTANQHYLFLVVVNGKIIKSLVSNVPLNEISEGDIQRKIKVFKSIF